RAHIEALLPAAQPILGEMVKPEMLQSVVEVGTKVCEDIAEARREILR
ncbi:MAG TPA: carboxylate-amine ligase, partial [Actinobacteria bacterium]|nr:carboxylate-amine ligase [Actinomycetota bacterium]